MWQSFLIGERQFMSDDVDCLTQKREMSIWLRLFSQMIMDAIPQPTMRSRLSPWVYLIFPLTLCDRLWSHSSCHLILLTAAVRVRVLHRWVRYLWDMEHSFAMYVPHVSLREGYKGNSKPDPNLLMGDVWDKAVVWFWRFPCDWSYQNLLMDNVWTKPPYDFGGVHVMLLRWNPTMTLRRLPGHWLSSKMEASDLFLA